MSETLTVDPVGPVAAPDSRPGNPFVVISLLIDAVADSLEAARRPNEPERWVRIVRVRQFVDPETKKVDAVAKGVMKAMDAFAKVVAFLQRFTLAAHDYLAQGDGAKALVEVSAAFLRKATEQEFYDAIQAAVGSEPPYQQSPLAGLAPAIDMVEKVADYVPSPEDLAVLGRALFRLLVIEQIADDEEPLEISSGRYIDLRQTGKVRLIQWGFSDLDGEHSIPLYNFESGDVYGGPKVEVTRLGSRRVIEADPKDLPAVSDGTWTWGEAETTETIFQLTFPTTQQTDIEEANKVLNALRYPPTPANLTVFGKELAQRLRTFQHINGIPVTGKLDNPTINGLLHLDYKNRTLKRAKRYRKEDVSPQFDATEPGGNP